MATKHFLNAAQREEASKLLAPPQKLPDGRETTDLRFQNADFSHWLSGCIVELLKDFPRWQDSGPVKLGSWARGELCPKSDIDMLFCGDESVTKEIVDALALKGTKLRYRMPKDPEDWTVGVEPFDILALLGAEGMTSGAQEKLKSQQERIRRNLKSHRREILKAIKSEREARSIRYDSIANFLEPNIKYGAGGLRDLHQGIVGRELFPEKFDKMGRSENVLKYYLDFFLTIRQKLHLLGGQDVLLAHYQQEISDWFGYKSRTDFMGQVELGLSRVSFYSDWMIAKASSATPSSAKAAQPKSVKGASPRGGAKLKLNSADAALGSLAKDSGILNQFEIRQILNELSKLSPAGFKRYFQIKMGMEFFDALFRSRIIDRIIPHLYPVFGLVQHDQYHRYSVDAHTLQCLKNICRLYKSKKYLAGMKSVYESLKPTDWEVLLWSCIYHDIGKGSGKPHEIYGAELVESDFKKFGLKKELADEVAWIVRNHLVLSQFAFRQNLRAPQTWQKLADKGVVGERLKRLAAFTALDIFSTNPEAWNPWKATLINDVVEVMSGKQAKSYLDFLNLAKRKKIKVLPEFLNGIDPMVIESLGPQKLLADYLELQKAKDDLLPLVVKSHRIWIRFHRKVDRPGIFLEFVAKLFSAGFNIQHAYVQTFPDLGVYDWFEIKTSVDAARIKKILEKDGAGKPLPIVKFSAVEVVSQDEKETVISFRGLDQPGVLANAARALTAAGLTINWARVLTWGRQFDDVFGVGDSKGRSSDVLLTELKSNMDF